MYWVNCYAQNDDILTRDSIDINSLYLEIHPVYDLDFYTKEYLDTLIDELHFFYPNEHGEFRQQFAPVLGQNLLPFKYKYPTNISFNNGYNNNNPYKFNLKNTPFYQNTAPYTFAEYVLGGNENYFNVSHAQNVAKPIDLAVRYRNINSEGIYQRQVTSVNNLGANAWFSLPNIRYQALVSYLWNRQNRQLNGGVIEDVFGASTIQQAEAAVYLNNAEERLIDKHLFFQQSFDFGPKRDSLNTQDSVYVEWIEPKWQLFHQFNLHNNDRFYTDSQSDTTYYSKFFVDNGSTQDSLYLKKYHNKFGITWLGKTSNAYSGIKAKASINHEVFKHLQTSSNDSTTYGNIYKNSGFWLSTMAQSDTAFLKKLKLKAQVNYGLSGWHKNTLTFSTETVTQIKQFNVVSGISYSQLNAPHIYNSYLSNHFIWDNNFVKIKTLSLKLSGAFKKDLLKLGYEFINQKNPVYLFENALAKQSTNTLQLHTITANVNLNFKWLYLQSNNYLQFENHTDIELPMLVSQNQIFYQGWLFKNNMQLQSGLIILYNSPYNAPSFNAALGQYNYGNSTQLTTYPTFDVFLNMKIKRVSLFLRTYNLNQGMLSNWQGMYAYPNHPLPDRSFKFGFSWAFYD